MTFQDPYRHVVLNLFELETLGLCICVPLSAVWHVHVNRLQTVSVLPSSLHNISDQLFLSQSRSSPALGSEGSRKDDKVLAHSELVDRFKVLIQKATDFLFMSGEKRKQNVSEETDRWL